MGPPVSLQKRLCAVRPRRPSPAPTSSTLRPWRLPVNSSTPSALDVSSSIAGIGFPNLACSRGLRQLPGQGKGSTMRANLISHDLNGDHFESRLRLRSGGRISESSWEQRPTESYSRSLELNLKPHRILEFPSTSMAPPMLREPGGLQKRSVPETPPDGLQHLRQPRWLATQVARSFGLLQLKNDSHANEW